MNRPKFSRPISCCLTCTATALVFGGGCCLVLAPVFRITGGMVCTKNLIQVTSGLMMYSADYDDRMPAGNHWMDAIYPYTKNEDVFHCPAVNRKPGKQEYGYAFNGSLVGMSIKGVPHPETVILTYDSDKPFRNAFDLVASPANPPRHHGGNNVGFLDGHAGWYRPKQIDKAVRKVRK